MDTIINKAYRYYNRALNLIDNSKVSLAKDELKKAVNAYPKDIDILNLMGVCEYYLCNFEEAYRYWTKSLKVTEQDNHAKEYIDFLASEEFDKLAINYNKAVEYVSEEKYKSAVHILKKIIRDYNELIEPYEILTMCYLKLNKVEEAEKCLDELLKKDYENLYYMKSKYKLKSIVGPKREDSKLYKRIKGLRNVGIVLLIIILILVLVTIIRYLN
ncbi:hypothetical protein SDC9_171437 [bioreactor metagenome]|uniref:Uncharacterized protein n=1 Tax=bioreactor metagenome TaxID=1076179 RepID=A0A645GJF8_9ZZZZ